jgi:flagellar biogenesis protein FliO
MGDYLRLMLVLSGILVLAVVAIRYWVPKVAAWKRPSNGAIKVCASMQLEPRRSLYIVKAAESYMLLASSESGVQHLASLSAAECAALEKEELPARAVPPFGDFFRQAGKS